MQKLPDDEICIVHEGELVLVLDTQGYRKAGDSSSTRLEPAWSNRSASRGTFDAATQQSYREHEAPRI